MDKIIVNINIEDGPVTPDFDGRSRGWQASIIIDPEDMEVTLYTCIGSTTPGNVWNGLALEVPVKNSAAGESLREILLSDEAQALLSMICDNYEGQEFDGHNMVGKWARTESPDGEFLEHLHHGDLDHLARIIDEQVKCYWSASDWLDGAWTECLRDVAHVLDTTDGKDREEAIASLVNEWTKEASANDALLDEADVRVLVDRMVEQVQRTHGSYED